MRNKKYVMKKLQNKKEINKMIKEYHTKYAKRDLEICNEWNIINKEISFK